MEIEVLMFAVARELTGCDVVRVDVAGSTQVPKVAEQTGNAEDNRDGQDVCNFPSAAVHEVMEALAIQFPVLEALLPSCRIAVDCEYVGTEARITPGVEVALIPPVSGG